MMKQPFNDDADLEWGFDFQPFVQDRMYKTSTRMAKLMDRNLTQLVVHTELVGESA